MTQINAGLHKTEIWRVRAQVGVAAVFHSLRDPGDPSAALVKKLPFLLCRRQVGQPCSCDSPLKAPRRIYAPYFHVKSQLILTCKRGWETYTSSWQTEVQREEHLLLEKKGRIDTGANQKLLPP